MNSDDNTRTSPTLLSRTADWRDHAAWQEFVAQYDPYIRAWCREYSLDDDLARDVSQQFWIELADKMRAFRYDPSRRFRGWLRRCFHWRAVDAIRERGREQAILYSIDDTSCLGVEAWPLAFDAVSETDNDCEPHRVLLLNLAAEVQAAVREKVYAQSWQVFWHIAIDGWTTRQTADALNMTYLAAHAAHKRVAARLAEEGSRCLAQLTTTNAATGVITIMTNCPPEESLRRIGTDNLSESTFATLERHVEECALCQKRLEGALNTVAEPIFRTLSSGTLPVIPGLVLERELGRGGASVVYLAYEPALSRHVAVKLFPKNSLVDPHAREHWLSEARALSRVPHDNVVAIHRVDENEDWLWLVLEYVPGGTLKDQLTEPLPPRAAARILETIARAVGYFHSRGVVHLDLKPSNVLLGNEPEVGWENVSLKVSDFGIARLEGEPGATETGANGPKGTPSYMAPEQVAAIRGTIGPAADIYALGALLYHLLTGRPPFQGTSTAETFDQVRNQEPVPPRRLNGRIPRDLETICLQCLEKAPKGRYASADLLATDLRLWLEGRPINARRISPLGHAWRWCRRHPAVAGLLILLGTTLATAVVGLFVFLGRVEAERLRLADSNRSAKAYEEFCSNAATQLALLLETSVHHHGDPSLEKKQATLLPLRDSILELIKQGNVPSSTVYKLGREISWALVACDKRQDAYDLSRQATQLLERRSADHPNDQQARDYFRESVLNTGAFAGRTEGRLEEAFNCFKRAAAIPWEPGQSEYRAHVLLDIHVELYDLNRRLRCEGRTSQQEHAERLTKQIRIQLVGHDFEGSSRLTDTASVRQQPLIQRDGLKAMFSPREQRRWHRLDELVAQWLTVKLEPLSSPRRSTSGATLAEDAEAWSKALICTIRERCAKLGIEKSIEVSALGILFENAANDAASLRKRGRLDDANATAARMVATAQLLVREYPRDARSHQLASEAYNQIRKNAFASHDDNLMMKALINAIEADKRALAIDPNANKTREKLNGLVEKFARIKADRFALGLPTPTLSSAPKANGG